jgi:RNA polymerase sigma factor (TIGR02999 family)
MHEITDLLKAYSSGDKQAFDRLIPLVDKELRKLAHHYMRNERPGNILQTTALVNEALIKLIRENIIWENRAQFYGFVARRMRQVLVDYARRTQRAEYVDVDDVDIPVETPREILLLDAALTKLASIDERKATIVECRFFIGLTNGEIAELLGVSQATVQRDWNFARAWLKHEMTSDPATRKSE